MASLSVSEVRANLSDAVNRVAYGKERILLKRGQKEVAALVSPDDLALLEQLEEKLDAAAAKKARKEKGGIAWEKVKAELGLV